MRGHHQWVKHSRSLPLVSLASLTLSMLGVGGLAGCAAPPSAQVSERLWVSAVPKGPRASTNAFVITKVRGRQLGSFYSGSMYRGTHQLFTWKPGARDRGRITLLQDNKSVNIRVATCKPTRGFDHCILLEGDPTNTVRYQSRKRWVIPGRGRRDMSALEIDDLMRELAHDDPELASLVEVF